jgi:hypothetical protein
MSLQGMPQSEAFYGKGGRSKFLTNVGINEGYSEKKLRLYQAKNKGVRGDVAHAR